MIRKILLIIALILILLIGAFYKEAKAEAPDLDLPDNFARVEYYATVYGVSSKTMTKVMVCESEAKDDAVGDKGKAYGPFQWWQESWDDVSKQYAREFGHREFDRTDPRDQAELTAYAFSKKQQRRWTCYRKLVSV